MASGILGRCSGWLMAAAKSASYAAGGKATGRSSGGLQKLVPVSPQLSKFLGVPEATRSAAVKKVWEHAKLHNLQNPTNKKVIRCDETLKTIFGGKESVGLTEIVKLLSAHFIKSN